MMKKNLKKAVSLALASVMALSLTACAGSGSKTTTAAQAEGKEAEGGSEDVTIKFCWWGGDASKVGRPDNCEALSGNSHKLAYPGLTRPNAPADRPVEYCGIHSSAHADIRLLYGHPAVSHCHRKASPQPHSNGTAVPSRSPNPRS